jgi:PTS system mannose-specific IIA component
MSSKNSHNEGNPAALGLLVVTHGRLAEELVDTVRTIVAGVDALEAVSIGWNDDVGEASRHIEEAIRRVDQGRGVLLLTDMFGGTPTNLALSLHDKDQVEIVTGVNVPMLIKFANIRQQVDLQEAAGLVAEQGRQAIQVASHLLESPEEEKP